MLTDTEIKIQGLKALENALGEIQTERFIALILREPFDYTEWQKNLWIDKTIDSISKSAMKNRQLKTKD